MSNVIEAEGLGFSYLAENGDVEVLRDIDLTLDQGSFLSIIGPSGCGKTSLLRLIAGLEEKTSGKLIICSENASFVFQQAALFPWATARENIAKPLKLSGKNNVDAKVDEALKLVRLSDFADKYPHQLSGGMQQRVSIARALVTKPDLLLMDEPFGALDEMTREAMNLELYNLWETTQKTVCFVTHSISEAVFLSTDILVLSSRPGQIISHIKSPLPKQRNAQTYETTEFLALVSQVRTALK